MGVLDDHRTVLTKLVLTDVQGAERNIGDRGASSTHAVIAKNSDARKTIRRQMSPVVTGTRHRALRQSSKPKGSPSQSMVSERL